MKVESYPGQDPLQVAEEYLSVWGHDPEVKTRLQKDGLLWLNMTHVVTEACVMHKYQDCVAVCPVEAFREADNYLVIDPDECIDCAACVTECPVEAIFADTDVPDDQEASDREK